MQVVHCRNPEECSQHTSQEITPPLITQSPKKCSRKLRAELREVALFSKVERVRTRLFSKAGQKGGSLKRYT